jgi:AraC family transcriptional regulator, positive regulator of tynA and feaB
LRTPHYILSLKAEKSKMETVTLQRENLDEPKLDFEAWRASFRSICGRYTLERAEPEAFAGWVRPCSALGFSAVDVACNENCIDRTQRDIRGDGMDVYGVLVQVAGGSTVIHNDQTVQLAKGDVLLVDKARPVSYVADSEGAHWLCLQFPRRPLISHLGFEPQGGRYKSVGTPAGRLPYEIALNALRSDDASFSPADSYMQLAVYDLVGALFVPDSWSGPRSTDKLFARVHKIIRSYFADPDFGPHELAADAGISLRYLHKLFAERGVSCREFIYSVRLDHAAQLLNRRSSKAQPLSEIAFACGFRDYAHFRRKFRYRFGYSPSSHLGMSVQHAGNGRVHAGTDDGASRVHDNKQRLNTFASELTV